ncbi:MAG: helix-hairpin-helix domain-containing protein [Lachnospiraceae bacterium]|nr:helix-hairpin-helix domain-containing protein [Lachnospiraceae bacterium]
MKSKKLVSVLLAVLFLLVFGIIFGSDREPEEQEAWEGSAAESVSETDPVTETETGTAAETDDPSAPESETEEETERVIYVYVCGHVAEEKVVVLPEGARVYEAVEKAGGFSEDAYTSVLNLAQTLKDGDKVYVPGEGDEKPEETAGITSGGIDAASETASAGQGSGGTENALVNINTASKEELMALPEIGEVRAERIIAYRKENGKFENIQSITNVEGISNSIFEKIKALICAE